MNERGDFVAQLLDGKKLAASMQAEMQSEVAKIKEKDGIVPGLVVICAIKKWQQEKWGFVRKWIVVRIRLQKRTYWH